MFLKTPVSIAILFLSAAVHAADVLSSLKIDPNSVTISGVSSGAFMAVQMGVAYSADIRGVASVAGGSYGCSQGDARRAQGPCMAHPEQVDVRALASAAASSAAHGEIDDLRLLNRQKIYIYASPKDAVIQAAQSEKLREFYGHFRSLEGIRMENSVPSAHGFPTVDQGNPCGLGLMPWLLKCGFDGAGEILQSMYGSLAPKVAAVREHLQAYAQGEFDPEHWLYHQGWVYVPAACERGGCRLHVALHGCQMNPDFIQDQFARLAGYNEWAESNRIVILYPQAIKLMSVNPYGCWDWFGYSGPNYAVKSGPQMRSLRAMISRLAE